MTVVVGVDGFPPSRTALRLVAQDLGATLMITQSFLYNAAVAAS